MSCPRCFSFVCHCPKPFPPNMGSVPMWDPINARPITPSVGNLMNPLSRLSITNPLNPLSPFNPSR